MPDTPRGSGRGKLLTPAEVAALFRVDPKTVTRWAAAGKLAAIRTPGGHRRFYESDVKVLLEGGETGGLASLDPEAIKSINGGEPIPARHTDGFSWESK